MNYNGEKKCVRGIAPHTLCFTYSNELLLTDLRCMGYSIQRVHLPVAVEPIVATAALAGGEESACSAWVKGIRWAWNRIGCLGEHRLHRSRRHLAELAED